jgi:hypothetical protein
MIVCKDGVCLCIPCVCGRSKLEQASVSPIIAYLVSAFCAAACCVVVLLPLWQH